MGYVCQFRVLDIGRSLEEMEHSKGQLLNSLQCLDNVSVKQIYGLKFPKDSYEYSWKLCLNGPSNTKLN